MGGRAWFKSVAETPGPAGVRSTRYLAKQGVWRHLSEWVAAVNRAGGGLAWVVFNKRAGMTLVLVVIGGYQH